MNQFDMKIVLNVMSEEAKLHNFSKTSKYIEYKLKETYVKEKYNMRKFYHIEEKRPLVNRALYEMILEKRELPDVKSFINYYFESSMPDLANRLPDRYLMTISYLSLVRDLHFYFILQESGYFTEVVIDYLYDLYGQTDILLFKDEKKLGMQLFHGSPYAEISKRKDLEDRNYDVDYELMLFSSKDSRGERLQCTSEQGTDFVLFSEKDARLLSEIIDEVEPVKFEDDLYNADIDKFEFIDTESMKEKAEITSTNLVAKHSILLIGNRYIQKYLKAAQEKYTGTGTTIDIFEIDDSIVKNAGLEPRTIIDGQDIDEKLKNFLKKHAEAVHFNIGQYLIIHATADSDINVGAGAGSGKTHTLVSRALFLLDMGYIEKIDELAMITFTNEAADNMRIKLAERFMELYRKTKNLKYRRHLEDLRNMQIQTIPSFAKSILQQFGHHIGLGSEFKVSNLTMDRREIIQYYLNEVVLKNLSHPEIFKTLQYHNVMKFIESVWEKIEQKGIMASDLAMKSSGKLFKEVIHEILVKSEDLFNTTKIEKNTLTVSDLTRFLKKLINKGVPLHQLRKKFKFLFVDEFQDTDNAQISFIGNVALQANIPLLVVGDVKQSIYRFRGANVSAFEELKKVLETGGRKPQVEHLIYNYRTSNSLLEKMEDFFDLWRKRDWLPENETRMKSRVSSILSIGEAFLKKERPLIDKDIRQHYNEMLQEDKNKVLAILVRTNPQAKEVGKILSQMQTQYGEMMPPFDVSLDGTLFKSLAAKDLLILLESWLKPEDPVALYALSQTVYCQNEQTAVDIAVDSKYRVASDYTFKVPLIWLEAQELLKFNPVLLVVNEFLSQVPYEESLENKPVHVQKKYQLNLYKILGLLYANIGEDSTDLLTIYNWLALQIETNQEEDEAELEATDFNRNVIKVMTVHKSKGLQFHTVILPYVEKAFVQHEPEINMSSEFDFDQPGVREDYANVLVQIENSEAKYGWLYFNKKDKFISRTESYIKLKQEEDDESIKEETRILYVAMTRTEQRLFIYNIKNKPFSINETPGKWSDLLNIGEI